MPNTSSPTLPASWRRMLVGAARLEFLHAVQRQPQDVFEDLLADRELQSSW